MPINWKLLLFSEHGNIFFNIYRIKLNIMKENVISYFCNVLRTCYVLSNKDIISKYCIIYELLIRNHHSFRKGSAFQDANNTVNDSFLPFQCSCDSNCTKTQLPPYTVPERKFSTSCDFTIRLPMIYTIMVYTIYTMIYTIKYQWILIWFIYECAFSNNYCP